MQHKDFDIDEVVGKLSRTRAMSLQDYRMVNDNLVRVIVSHVGEFTREDFLREVAKLFNGIATPVRNSFKKLTEQCSLGFVYATPDVRVYEEDAKEENAKYRVVANNILMDRTDESMWELRSGAAGKYLCRHGMEDLAEMAQGAMHRSMTQPRFTQVHAAMAAPREFVSFVNASEGEVDYGYVVARDEGKVEVISASTQQVEEVADELVVAAIHLNGSDVKASGGVELAEKADKSTQVDYWKKHYNYAPEYVEKIKEMIDQHAVA